MTKAQIYLHIGLHKTGTTMLQHDIFPLLKGINYIPRSTYERQVLDIILQADMISFERKLPVIKNCFEKSFDNREKVLISHELFSGNPFFGYNNRYSVLMKLKKLFPDAKIMIGIRSQRYIIDSLYREYITQGGTKPFEHFIIAKIPRNRSVLGHEPYLDPDTFHYGVYLDKISSLFGDNNLFVYPAEKLFSNRNEFINDLLMFFDLEQNEAFDGKPLNRHKSISNSSLKISRFCNKFHRSVFNPGGLLPFQWNPTHLFRHFDFTRIKRSNDESLFKLNVPVDYREDNQYIDKKFKLGLHEKFNTIYNI